MIGYFDFINIMYLIGDKVKLYKYSKTGMFEEVNKERRRVYKQLVKYFKTIMGKH